MKQSNFLKVVDTLEKFQDGLVNTQSPAGKEFVLFKRELYNMYEVQNRSIEEHQSYSMGVDRRNLRYLYNANIDFVDEMTNSRRMDQAADYNALKGRIFQAKSISQERIRGVAGFGLASTIYIKWIPISLMMGPTLPILTAVCSTMYGMRMLNNARSVNYIEIIEDGDHAGKLRLNVAESPFVSKNIIATPRQINVMVGQAVEDHEADTAI